MRSTRPTVSSARLSITRRVSPLGGEVLVSNLVRELVAGPGIDFLESREVKGLDGSHRLFAVDLA